MATANVYVCAEEGEEARRGKQTQTNSNSTAAAAGSLKPVVHTMGKARQTRCNGRLAALSLLFLYASPLASLCNCLCLPAEKGSEESRLLQTKRLLLAVGVWT